MAGSVAAGTVRSRSSGAPGRALNQAGHNPFVLDSPAAPNEAVTNSEAFLAGISSCGVTLVEKYALEHDIPVRRMFEYAAGPAPGRAPGRRPA